jgi:DUF1680 family protein
MRYNHILREGSRSFLFFLLAIFTSLSVQSQEYNCKRLDLSNGWKIKKGDNKEWSSLSYDDSKWDNVRTREYWENPKCKKFLRAAWYRLKVKIPSSLKGFNAKNYGFSVLLGKIDDEDITYFNGERIGESKGNEVNRCYYIPEDKIKWDAENLIAVRVINQGGNGGFFMGPYLLKANNITDVLDLLYHGELIYLDKSSLSKRINGIFTLRARNNIHVKGRIEWKVIETENNKSIVEGSDYTEFSDSTKYNFSFVPCAESSYRLYLKFIDAVTGDTVCSSPLIAYYPKYIPNRIINQVVKPKINDKIKVLPFEGVKLQKYFKYRMNINLKKRLYNVDEVELCEGFYDKPGYQAWIGEHVGKYLDAASNVWRYTHDQTLKAKMDRIADILINCQESDGYLGTYLYADRWTSWDVWVHKYNIIGLLNYYSVTGYKPALLACTKMGDLICNTFGVGKNQKNLVEAGTHRGMAATSILEAMTDLYLYTGNVKYLKFCRYIIADYESEDGPKIISSLFKTRRVDQVANAKAYEMLSNLLGLIEFYKIEPDKKILEAVKIAWNDILKYRLYITGTMSSMEFFKGNYILPADNAAHMGEGCVTTTWVQLNEELFNLTGDIKYMNEIEKSVYNHLLGAESVQTGCVSYYTPLQGKKPYNCALTCCLSSVPRAISLIPELCISKDKTDDYIINLYNPCEIVDTVKDKFGRKIKIDISVTKNLKESIGGKEVFKILFRPEKIIKTKLLLRVPQWAENYTVKIDGNTYRGRADKYITLNKIWNRNSEINVYFNLHPVFISGGKSYPGCFAIKYGPRILSIDQTYNPSIQNINKVHIDKEKVNFRKILNHNTIQSFKINAFVNNKPVEITLVPFAEAGQDNASIITWIKNK